MKHRTERRMSFETDYNMNVECNYSRYSNYEKDSFEFVNPDIFNRNFLSTNFWRSCCFKIFAIHKSNIGYLDISIYKSQIQRIESEELII